MPGNIREKAKDYLVYYYDDFIFYILKNKNQGNRSSWIEDISNPGKRLVDIFFHRFPCVKKIKANSDGKHVVWGRLGEKK